MSNIMKSLKTYITEAKTEYPFRLKFAVDITDDDLDALESCLDRYGVKSVSKATKTIMQKHPMDFGNLPAGEIHIVDIVLEYPTTPDTLTSYLHSKLGVPQSHLVVRSPNNPEEVQNYEAWNTILSGGQVNSVDDLVSCYDYWRGYERSRK